MLGNSIMDLSEKYIEVGEKDIPDVRKPIFVIGFMASGKTTFARALAKALNRDFIDLDFYIEQRFRKSIPVIFAEEGEESFRTKESSMLREAGEFDNTVIACGGGTPCFNDNMTYMKSRGLTVYLDTSLDCIVRRLIANNSRRPLMAGRTEEEIRHETIESLTGRMKFYRQADMTFEGDELENRKEITRSVERFLGMLKTFHSFLPLK